MPTTKVQAWKVGLGQTIYINGKPATVKQKYLYGERVEFNVEKHNENATPQTYDVPAGKLIEVEVGT